MSQQIAVDISGNIDVVWSDNTPGSPAVFFSRSSDGGSTFSAPKNISNNTGSTAFTPQIAVDPSGNIYVTWRNFVSSTSSTAEFSRSTDGGANFSTPVAISQGTTATEPQIAVERSGAIDFIWTDNSSGTEFQVFFSRSIDQGETLSPPADVSNDPGGAGTPALAVDPQGDIDVAWFDFTTGAFGSTLNDLLFSSSVDHGASFLPATQVTTFFGDQGAFPGALRVAASSSTNIGVVWAYQLQSAQRVAAAYSSNGGASFTLASVEGGGEFPSVVAIAAEANAIDVLTSSSGGDDEAPILFSRFGAGVAPKTTRIVDAMANEPDAQIAVDSTGAIDIVTDAGIFRSSTPSAILFSRSTDSGATFSQQQITSNGSVPAMALDAIGNVYVVWQAFSSNNDDIFFSRTLNASLSSVSFIPASVTGGDTSIGTVTLSTPAPPGGAEVSLLSSNIAVATVEASLTIPAGSTSATFNVATTSVLVSAPVTISATSSGGSASGVLMVLPLAPASLKLGPSTVRGAEFSIGTVTLSGPAPPGGAVIVLSSRDRRAVLISPRVTVSAGQTSAVFRVLALPVFSQTSVVISASYNSTTVTAVLSLEPLIDSRSTRGRRSFGDGGRQDRQGFAREGKN